MKRISPTEIRSSITLQHRKVMEFSIPSDSHGSSTLAIFCVVGHKMVPSTGRNRKTFSDPRCFCKDGDDPPARCDINFVMRMCSFCIQTIE